MSKNVPLDNSTALRNDIFHGWMPPPNTRSTTDIVWTCLATIILCVYTAVHLNIPEPGEALWRQMLRRSKWVLVAILAPEIVLQAAWKQFSDARDLQSRLKGYAKRYRATNISNHKSKGFIAPMVEMNSSDESAAPKQVHSVSAEEIENIPDPEDISLTYAFYAVMGGFRIKLMHGEHAGRTYALTPLAIDKFAEVGCFWNISTASIQDKSKADYLAKLLTVLQVLWMFTQCIGRRAQNLPLTILEIHTFIHAICAAIMFGIWFKKPLNIRDATVRRPALETQDLVENLLRGRGALTCQPDTPLVFVLRRTNFGRDPTYAMSPWDRIFDSTDQELGIDALFDDSDSRAGFWFNIIITPAIYGSLHMIAWNAHFPTVVEKWFWRAACISVASGAFIGAIVAVGLVTISDRNFLSVDSTIRKYSRVNCFPSWLVYCVSNVLDMAITGTPICFLIIVIVGRGFIVVESVISLRSVPIGVYAAVQWSKYIPHL